MIKRLFFSILLGFFFSLSAYANSDAQSLDTGELKLCNSSEVNILFVLDVGDAELYLPDCEVLDYSEFMLAITYNRPFTAEEFIASSDELVSRNNSRAIYQQIKTDLDYFNSHYQAVEKGEEYRISYTFKKGLNLQKNGKILSSSDNALLAKAYFKIWFGDRPFHKKMKKELLKNIRIPATDLGRK